MENDQDGDRPGVNPEEIVGYKRPPKHSRWPPGYCPNPAGRPRKAKGRKPILERIAYESVEVMVAGKLSTITRLEAVLLAVRNATANAKAAAQTLFDKLLNAGQEEGPPISKGVLIVGEKLTAEEWVTEYGPSGELGSPPKAVQMADCEHLLKKNRRSAGARPSGN